MTEDTMKDVSHTSPAGVSAAAVWERGGEGDSPADADGAAPAPADD